VTRKSENRKGIANTDKEARDGRYVVLFHDVMSSTKISTTGNLPLSSDTHKRESFTCRIIVTFWLAIHRGAQTPGNWLCTVTSNTCGSSGQHLLHVTLPARHPEFWGGPHIFERSENPSFTLILSVTCSTDRQFLLPEAILVLHGATLSYARNNC
jgi:hypothetical protein